MDFGKFVAFSVATELRGSFFASTKALHGFIKKTRKTPDAELKLALKRKREFA
jgi:phage-related protein